MFKKKSMQVKKKRKEAKDEVMMLFEKDNIDGELKQQIDFEEILR